MRRIAIAFAALLALALPGDAQVDQDVLPPNTVIGRTGIGTGPSQAVPFAILAPLILSAQAHFQINSTGPAPTLTAGCTGAGSIVSGNDIHGTITGSTAAATSCTLSFGTPYGAAPDCSLDGLSSPLTGAITVGTGSIVVNFTSTANYKWSYICLGT